MVPQAGIRPILPVEDSPMDVDLTLEAFQEHSVANRVIPVVVLTTSRENRDIDAAWVSSYIVKPVEFAKFADVVKTINICWLLTNEPPFPDHHGR